jgi:DNA-binding LytR/AlgR family response regulator
MLKTVIVEDETLAAKKLEALIKKYDTSIEILAKLPSIKEAVKWFNQNTPPDLIFMDIHLEDGLSFAIFEAISLQVPVIFTTAFDEYTINAFKVNSIDYLLKPINYEDLSKSLDKFHQFKKQFGSSSIDIKNLLDSLTPKESSYKTRFLINEGNNLLMIDITEVAYFFAEDKFAFLITQKGKQHLIDLTLDKLTQALDPKVFYRVNRQFILSAKSIGTMSKYGTNKLRVNLIPASSKEVFVSMDKYTDFKTWLDS